MADPEEEEEAELPPWSRTYADYRSRFVNNYELDLGGTFISLAQAPCVSADHAREAKASADGSCTAGTVWDAGIVLAAHVFEKYQCGTQKSDVSAVRCLDLGSGTGIVGIAAAASGSFSRVVLTDLPSVTPLLERNAASNQPNLPSTVQLETVPMRWDDDGDLRRVASLGPFHLIVGGDLLYRPQVVQPLLHALSALTTRNTIALLAASLQHSPETIRLFKHTAAAAGFYVELLDREEQSAVARSDEVRMLRVTRKKKRKQTAERQSGSGKRPAAPPSGDANKDSEPL